MYTVDGIAYAGEPVEGLLVRDARVTGRLSMLVTFSTGETRVFDAEPLLRLPVFAPLADQEVFERFALDRGVVCWLGGEVDLAPEAMYKMSYRYDLTA